MIRRIMFCSLVFLFLLGKLVQGQINHQVTFTSEIKFSKEILDDGKTYVRVKIPQTVLMDSVGFPSLPVKYVKLIVPANATDLNVLVNNVRKQNYKLTYKVEPLQQPIPIGFYDKPGFVKPDERKYNSNAPYPSQLVRIVESGYFKGNHLVTLAVFPCQYYPKKDELEHCETIDFTLNYKEEGAKYKTNKNAEKYPKHKKILESLIDNPSDIKRFYNTGENLDIKSATIQSSTSAPKSTVAGSGISIDCDYVVVTSQSLAPAFNEFIAWKRRKGIDIELVTIENIKANYTGDAISGISDDAGKLRQFLSDFYNQAKEFQYALLGGDNTVIPIRYAYYNNNTTDENYIIPTDLYFSEFEGDWEVDNDGRYGEPYVSGTGQGDNVDFLPDIYIGRVMVTNADEVRNWTKKIFMYEQNPGKGDYSYLSRAFITQADELQQGNEARKVLDKATWITDDTIFEESGGFCTSTVPTLPTGKAVIDEFNNHYGLCSFMGHGGPNNVALATIYLNTHYYCDYSNNTGSQENTKRKVTSFDNGGGGCCWIAETENGFDNMTNINHPSIYYSVSCTTMPFDDFGIPANDRNMGETYTCISKGGGPTYIGNTRYGYVGGSSDIFASFVDILSKNTSFNTGIVDVNSKLTSIDRYLRYSCNLIGCPEMEIWTATPSTFTNPIVMESGSTVTVSVAGVNNTTMCVMSALDNGSSYFSSVPVAGTYNRFYNVPKPYIVTVTKHNYIPYIKNPSDIYIQNETLNSEKYIYATNFHAGENVTTSKPTGPAIIQNGSNIVFDANNQVNLKGGFSVELGALFEAK